MADEFLRKLYEMSDGDYKIFDRYRVGSEVGLSNSKTDDIIDACDIVTKIPIE